MRKNTNGLCFMKQQLTTKLLTLTIILTLVLALTSVLVYADRYSLTEEDGNRSYRHTHYDDHNGMSQWHSTKMLQDEKGFMWFATWNGLNRFDGYEFAVFKSQPGDGNNLASDRIRGMLLGDDGHIYCAVNNRIWRFNLKTYKFEDVDADIQERYLAKLSAEKEVWPSKEMNIKGHVFPDVRQVLQDTQKNFWVMCTYGIDKVSLMPQVTTPLNTIPQDIVRCMYIDHKGRIWITTRNKKCVAVLDKDANLIGYLGEDFKLHKEMTAFVSPVYMVYQQKNGTFWLGSKPDGLYRLHETSDGVFTYDNWREGTVAEAKDGKKPNSGYIYDIKEDGKGRLWLATQGGGLNLIENPEAAELNFKNYSNVMKSYPQIAAQLRRVEIVGDTLLLATSTDGFLVVQGLKGKPADLKFRIHTREAQRAKSLSSSALMDMLFDRKGRLFLSTESGGVEMLETNDLTAEQLEFCHFNTSNGMGSDAALAMAEVGDEILVQCNNQVTRINADTNVKENFNDLFFTMESRFSDAEPLLLKNGMWLLSLETGVLMIPETSFHHHQYIPRLVLTSVSIPGKPVEYAAENSDTIRLRSNERDVIINYAALDFTENAHIKYVTRITEERSWWESEDTEEWSTPRESRSTGLYNMEPGTYIFEVRSTNAEGLWVNNVRKVTIIVEPTFWEAWYGMLIGWLIIIGIIVGVTYIVIYIRNLRHQREENLQAYLKLISAQEKEKEDGIEESAEETGENTVVMAHLNEEDEAFMRRLMDFIDKNISNGNAGVEDMADATATSRSSLNRKMRQILGVTPADFLREARIKKACQMLEKGNKGVNDIAYACGFSDPKYFSKVFKTSMGLSPSEYRLAN